jgi:uncharacterized protein
MPPESSAGRRSIAGVRPTMSMYFFVWAARHALGLCLNTVSTASDLEPAFALAPEIIILGTGHGACAPNLELMQSLAAKSIGLEIMNTPAACRTYNVLVHEQRRVVAALLV